jgi:predicted GIY-YIG superfamily endonuclease
VRPIQQLLFPDPRPLVERLGREFFRQLPETPGIYLMRDAGEQILYVGKAKNLRKRLGSYRVANPDRMARRHLRLLRAVARIEIQECASETCALAREAEMLRTLRPKFNRSGTWVPPARHLAWRLADGEISLTVLESCSDGWRLERPRGMAARTIRVVLARLLWLTVHPQLGFQALPVGWADGDLTGETIIDCGTLAEAVASNLENLFRGAGEEFCQWVAAQLPTGLHCFEKSWIEADLQLIAEAYAPITGAGVAGIVC